MKKTCAFSTIEIFGYSLLLFIFGGLSHFAYELSGNNWLVGLFNPINESVWEHLKFMFFPLLLWWLVLYQVKRRRCNATPSTWIVSGASSLIIAPLLVILFYYSYTGAFGIASLAIDLLISVASFGVSLSIASHLLNYSTPSKLAALISVIVVISIFVLFVVYTISPPNLPLFVPSASV